METFGMSLKQTLTFLTQRIPEKWRGKQKPSLRWRKKEETNKQKTKPGTWVFSEDKWSTPGVLPPKARGFQWRLRLIGWFLPLLILLSPYPFSRLFVTQSLGLRLKLYTRELPSTMCPPPTLHASLMPSYWSGLLMPYWSGSLINYNKRGSVSKVLSVVQSSWTRKHIW